MFTIDVMSRVPVYEQIIDQLERLVLTGALRPGEQIPSVRGLSTQLSINPNTIQKAYSELDRRGILCSVPGRGCFISDNAFPLLGEYKRKDLEKVAALARDLRLAGIDKNSVLAAVERAYRENGAEDGTDIPPLPSQHKREVGEDI